MNRNFKENAGLRRLYRAYQRAFRIPENLNYYSAEDFKAAERNFIRHGLLYGDLPFPDLAHPGPP